ncbi:MAG: hypothetical protein KDA89_06330 [Planctomycetaceae bacterium]|nr:hypothetical protein [Planctomycetaceae bacterium]
MVVLSADENGGAGVMNIPVIHGRADIGRLHGVLRLLPTIVLCMMSVQPVAAQPAPARNAWSKLPVRMRLEPLTIRGRSSSPLPVQIKLEYNRNQILEGDLLLEIYNSVYSPDDLMATIRYDGIALQGADFFFNTILPPIEHSYNKQYLVTGWFETKTERIPLTADPDLLDPPEPHELLTIGLFERATLTCSCSGDSDYLRPSRNRLFLNNVLSPDKYSPQVDLKIDNPQIRQTLLETQRIQNYSANWDALELREDPLYLCAFDMVLLADGSLGRLDKRQLDALQVWVEAGGSLCVLPDDKRLTKLHLQFLQSLFEPRHSDTDIHLSLTDEGQLLVISDESLPVVHRRCGLGRVTLLPAVESLETQLSLTDIGTAVAHLWKLHSDSPVRSGNQLVVPSIEETLAGRGQSLQKTDRGYVIAGEGISPHTQRSYPDRSTLEQTPELAFQLPPKPGALTSITSDALIPEGVTMVPTSVIVLLLLAYVTAIGPADYLVLGWFRARKYTWILFPATTAVFTAVTLWIAHRYMSSSETGQSLTIVDVLEDGRAARLNNLQMLFYSAQTTTRQTESAAFVVPAKTLSGTVNLYGGYAQTPQPQSVGGDAIRYAGRFPQSYETERHVRQWEPQIIRTMSLAPQDVDIPQLPWDDIQLVRSEDGRRKLATQIRSAFPESLSVDAVVLHRQQVFSLITEGQFFSPGARRDGRRWSSLQTWERRHSPLPRRALVGHGLEQSSVVTGTRDYFSFVSQVSPEGSACMEDLPLLDPTSDQEWLLIVLTENNDGYVVWRRLFVDAADRPQP